MNEKFILTNVNGIAMDGGDTRFSALAVKNGTIRTVGSEEDVRALMDNGWPVRDMGGRTLLPGFIDTHQHLGLTGQVLNGIDLRPVRSMDEILDKVKQAAAETADDAWVLGYSLNELDIRERRMPLKEDLDAVCDHLPVMLVHTSWHFCSLNSLAFEKLALPPDLAGMDRKGGEPTGVMRDPGVLSHVFPAVSAMTPESAKMDNFKAACRAAMKQGITTLHCLEGGEFGPGDTRIVVKNQDELPLHTVIWNQVMDIEETLELGLPRIGGCICADGAMSARTAAVLEPYSDDPTNYGTLNFTQAVMDDFIMRAHAEGLQVAIHCETDGAVEQVLSAMEKAIAAHPRNDHRHRIEHCELTTMDQLERMARAGIIASMQPAFLPYLVDWDDYTSRFGPKRMRMLQCYRTMLDTGVKIIGGSDGPITPYWPLIGVQAAVLHPIEEERLTPIEALRMFTIDAAYSGFDETERGSIEPGKKADFVVLGDDPTQVAPETIADIPVEGIFVNGQSVKL